LLILIQYFIGLEKSPIYTRFGDFAEENCSKMPGKNITNQFWGGGIQTKKN
jgi:hypothetical protein